MDEPKKKKQHHKYLQLTGIAFQMGAIMYLAAYAGKKLDIYFQSEKNIFTLIVVLIGLAASIWIVLRQLKNINH